MCKRLRIILLLLLFSPLTWAAPPSTLGFQGNLADLNGDPISAALAITFRLYDVQSGGTELWSETQPNVIVSGGNFTVELGTVTPLPKAALGKQLYLGIQVAGDSEMAPRPPLTAASYALRAERTLKNTVLVSAEGTAAENGAALLAAFAALPTATANDPQTVELDTGTFDLGTASLTVPSYVTLVGRGQNASIITGAQTTNTYVVGFRSHSQGREFTVRSTPSAASAWAIGIHGAASFNDPVDDVLISHVTADTQSPTAVAGATRFGISACMNNSTIEHSTAIARGGSSATALAANCAMTGAGGNFMTLSDLRLFASGAGITVRGANLAGGGPWKDLFVLAQVDQATITNAIGLLIQYNALDVGAGLVDSNIVLNGSVQMTSANAYAHGLHLASPDLNVRNLHVGVEDVSAQYVRGVYAYADAADHEPEISGLSVNLEAVQYAAAGAGEVAGIAYNHAGGRLVDGNIFVDCDEAAYNRCAGFHRFSNGGNPSQGRLELDRATFTVRVSNPADGSVQSVGIRMDDGDIAVRNSSLRVLRSALDEYAAAIDIPVPEVNAIFENSTLSVEAVNPTPAPVSAVLNGNTGSREFYGNTIRGAFNNTGGSTPICIGNAAVGSGFLASTCP